MTNEEKRQVRDALMRYVNKFDTQSHASESLQGISASTISQVRNNNWELLSDRLWYHIARQVGYFSGEWQPADTSAYLLLRILFSDAQHYGMTYGIAIGEGLGKTFTAVRYAHEETNAIYLEGNDQMNRKSFMTALMRAANASPLPTVPEMVAQFTAHVCDKEEPLVIIDNAHKLKDRVLHMVILLANSIANKAGIVMMGADSLRTRIIDGVRLKKVGYDEIYKSIGRRFITLSSLGPRDVELICRANGLHHEDLIDLVKEGCGNNLHNAASLIQSHSHISIAA